MNPFLGFLVSLSLITPPSPAAPPSSNRHLTVETLSLTFYDSQGESALRMETGWYSSPSEKLEEKIQTYLQPTLLYFPRACFDRALEVFKQPSDQRKKRLKISLQGIAATDEELKRASDESEGRASFIRIRDCKRISVEPIPR